MTSRPPLRRTLLLASLSLGLVGSRGASAHDFKVGDLSIDHPYALPTPPGIRTGSVYFRGIRNRGRQADRLIGATTDIAGRVEIHETVTTNDVARMREADGIDLPAGRTIPLRHGQRYHLMLVDLKRPLVDGERFDITVRFERAGERTVQAWVQTPKGGAASAGGGHRH